MRRLTLIPVSKRHRTVFLTFAIAYFVITTASLAVFLFLLDPDMTPAGLFASALFAGVACTLITLAALTALLSPRTKTDTSPSIQSGTVMRLTRGPEVASPPSIPYTHLSEVRRSAKQLNTLQEELVRRIFTHYRTDRQMHRLLAKMQICSHRLYAQISECCETKRRDRHTDKCVEHADQI